MTDRDQAKRKSDIFPAMSKSKKPDKDPADKQQRNNGTANLIPYRFKPGVSGNPNGRPPDELLLVRRHKELANMPAPQNLIDELRRQGAIPQEWEKGGRKLTWGDALTIRNLFKATSPRGDKTMEIVWHMMEGKPTERLEIQTPEGPSKSQFDPRKLSIEDLRALRDLREQQRQIIEKARVEQAKPVEEGETK
jgi:hypothetical protein